MDRTGLRPSQRNRLAATDAPYHPPARRGPRRCQCGNCSQCLDDDRWERIFQEKFADKDYYSRRTLAQPSPLVGA